MRSVMVEREGCDRPRLVNEKEAQPDMVEEILAGTEPTAEEDPRVLVTEADKVAWALHL